MEVRAQQFAVDTSSDPVVQWQWQPPGTSCGSTIHHQMAYNQMQRTIRSERARQSNFETLQEASHTGLSGENANHEVCAQTDHRISVHNSAIMTVVYPLHVFMQNACTTPTSSHCITSLKLQAHHLPRIDFVLSPSRAQAGDDHVQRVCV
jgi:hypothetical protein